MATNVSNRAVYFEPDSDVNVSFLINNTWQRGSPQYFFNGFVLIMPGYCASIRASIPVNAKAAKFSLKYKMYSLKETFELRLNECPILSSIMSRIFDFSFSGRYMPEQWSDEMPFQDATVKGSPMNGP